MREIRTPSSMSGKERRSDGLLGERGNERRRAPQAPPVLHATALLLDSTGYTIVCDIGCTRWLLPRAIFYLPAFAAIHVKSSKAAIPAPIATAAPVGIALDLA